VCAGKLALVVSCGDENTSDPCDELWDRCQAVIDEVCEDWPDCSICGTCEEPSEEDQLRTGEECEEILETSDQDSWVEQFVQTCEYEAELCYGYNGTDECCTNWDACDLANNDICDCDSTCAWDAIDCSS
jgi:hypothetical protein